MQGDNGDGETEAKQQRGDRRGRKVNKPQWQSRRKSLRGDTGTYWKESSKRRNVLREHKKQVWPVIWGKIVVEVKETGVDTWLKIRWLVGVRGRKPPKLDHGPKCKQLQGKNK